MKKQFLLLTVFISILSLGACSSNNENEYKEHHMRNIHPLPAEKFLLKDTNKDGKLSFKEFKIRKNRTQRMGQGRKKLNKNLQFKKMDKNSDGFVTKKEMKQFDKSEEKFYRKRKNHKLRKMKRFNR